MLDITVIGCGGIGGYVLERLPMAIASLSLDMHERAGRSISRALASEGTDSEPLALVVDRLTFVDGDDFSPRNSLRQGEGAGNKVVMRYRALKDSVLTSSWLRNLRICGVRAYVTPDNFSELLSTAGRRSPNASPGAALLADLEEVAGDSDIRRRLSSRVIFVCVDNAKTRYEVSRCVERMDNVLLINGGNEKTTGHVTLYERSGGVALDPPLYELYPDVAAGTDVRPDERHCDAVAPKHDQIALTNSMIADVMMSRFVSWVQSGLTTTDRAGRRRRTNEVLIDIMAPSVVGVQHQAQGSN